MGNIHKGRSPNSLFTKIPNQLIRNTNISNNTFRFICWVSSHNDGFKVSFASIKSSLGYGRDKLRSIITEAENNNYLVRMSLKNSKGQFDWDYFVFADIDECIDFQRSLSPEVGQPETDQPGVGKPPTAEPPTGQPSTGLPTDGREPPHKKNNLKEDQIKEEKREEEEPTPPGKKGKIKEEESAQLEISPFVKQPTHLAIADNPSLGSKVPLPPLKQVNTNAYSNAADIYELIELWLADSEYMSDATVPIAVREKIKWSGWQLPWRSPFHSVYQSFNPGIVQKLAAELAKKSGGNANDKISHAIATINSWERTKGGWSNLLSLCDRPIKESEPEVACEVDFKSMLKSQHEVIFDRDYLRSTSIEEFYQKCSWYKSWHKYAETTYPEWTWNAIK